MKMRSQSRGHISFLRMNFSLSLGAFAVRFSGRVWDELFDSSFFLALSEGASWDKKSKRQNVAFLCRSSASSDSCFCCFLVGLLRLWCGVLLLEERVVDLHLPGLENKLITLANP